MKQRLKKSLAILLAMALLVGLFPAGAVAADDSVAEDAVEYSAATPEEFATVVGEIEAQSEDDATIRLTADIKLDKNKGFAGVEEKKVTLTSEGEEPHSLTLATELVGDVTLDNVEISGSDASNYVLYACGHTFETTDAYKGKMQMLFGGGPEGKDVQGNTNLIIRGGTIVYIYGGGEDSNVSGNTNVWIDASNSGYDTENHKPYGTVTIDNVYGGGKAISTKNGKVGGDVNLTLRQGFVKHLVGGGDNQTGEAYGREPATISGDINVTVGYKGANKFSALFGPVTDSMAGPYHSTVTNIHMNLLEGAINYYPANEDGDKYFQGSGDVVGAGMYSDVLGTIDIRVENAYIKRLVGGALVRTDSDGKGPQYNTDDGYDCRILNQKGEENALHIVWNNEPEFDAVQSYTQGIQVLNDLGKQDERFFRDYVNGNVLIEFQNGNLDYIDVNDNAPGNSTLDGDAKVLVTGGRVGYIRGNSTNYENEEHSTSVEFNGCSNTEVGYLYQVNQATLKNNAQVCMDALLFEEAFYGDSYLPFRSVDNLSVESGSTLTTQNNDQAHILNDVTLQGTWDQKYASGNVQPEKDADLQIDGSLTVDGGTLISRGTAYVQNNLDADGGNLAFYQPAVIGMSEEGKGRTFDVSGTNLYLPVIGADDTFYPDGDSLIRLGIGEKATGTANVYLFDGDDYTTQATLTDDNIGQNYINGQRAVSDATFTLANDAATTNGYYFKRVDDTKKTSPTAYDMWQIAKDEPQAEPVTITPLTQTIYTGGTDGEGADHNFPHPIYVKGDGSSEDSTTVSDDEVFLVDGVEWQATEENPYPFTVKYYYKTGDNAGQELTDDAHFGDYEARIVPVDGVDLTKITTKDGAKVDFNSGTLRIRYVSNATEASGNELTSEALFYTDENKDTVRQEVENKANVEPAIILPENTTIYLNGNTDYPYPKENAGAYNISLLFDELLPRTGGGSNQGFIDELIDHAESKGFDLSGKDTDFKYLDLVDSNNSNAWVSSSRGSEVFWPYPEGTDKNDEFQLLHFKGLHREYSMPEKDNIYDQIDASEVEPVEIKKTDAGIWFHVGASGFSPFALVYDKEDGGVTPPPVDPGEPGGGDDNNPPALNTEDHFSYVVGYEDGMVKPQRNITRAEVSSIFYRLLEDEVRDKNTTNVSEFSDVKAGDWYGTTVATLSKMGIVKGYEDGTFRPNAPITRAEFAAIATRFFEETGAEYEPGTFTDVTGDEWFAGAIQDAVNLGLIGGYEDGTVRPNNNITRAEACAIVNRTLGRVPDADHLLPADEMKTWPDNKPSDWFYADMQEATNGHEYEWIKEDGNKVEQWTALLDKDWNDRNVK